MREFRIRTDLERAVVGGFALPLGFEPGRFVPPVEGYTLAYNASEGDDPDTYTFQAVVSHEKLARLCERCFDLLPDEIFAIVEIGSRDAYRSVDVYLGQEAIGLDEFRNAWKHFEPFLLEDTSIAAGANAEEPFVELFVDQRKSVILHVPLSMRDEAEAKLQEFGLEEVLETWPDTEIDKIDKIDEDEAPRLRSVLDIADAWSPDVDELLLQLRQGWNLELNLDPDVNTDEAGRELGLTLWHAVVIVVDAENDGEDGAYLSMWLTARSLSETERLIQDEIDRHQQYTFGDIYTVDRVAFDERPEQMRDLAPRRSSVEVHHVKIEPWSKPPGKGDEAEVNTDEAGRELGLPLWHAEVILFNAENDGEDGTCLSMWLTARDRSETERLIEEEIARYPGYTFGKFRTVDCVAFDERPDQMRDLAPRRSSVEVHHVKIEPWNKPPEEGDEAEESQDPPFGFNT